MNGIFHAFERMMIVGAISLPLLACSVDTDREVRTTEPGVQVEERRRVEVDPDVQARARELGQDAEHAGREAGREIREGADELRSELPEVDVDVDVRERNPD
jgi:hypothetical protein